MVFTRGDFHWNPGRYIQTEDVTDEARECEIKAAILILNKLSPIQQEAVRLYGRSCREEGTDNGLAIQDHD